MNIQPIADFPQIPQLASLVRDTADTLEVAAKPDFLGILKELPGQGAHDSFHGRQFVYALTFQVSLGKMTGVQQRQVLKALKLFCTEGWRYRSLQNKKLQKGGSAPQSPAECDFFRASDEIRVTWTYDKMSVTFHNVFLRGQAGWSER